MNEHVNLNPILLFLLFVAALFLVNYYELFYILEPIRSGQFGKKPSLAIYLGFNFVPKLLFYAFKFLVLSAIVYGCGILLNITSQNTTKLFKQILPVVILLEYIFILAKVYKILYFEFGVIGFSIEDYTNFYPFSFYDPDSQTFLNKLMIDFSVFDLIYTICLFYGIKLTFGISVRTSTIMVIYSYLFPLVLWDGFLKYLGF